MLAVAGFAFWQGAYDAYWFLTLAPSAVVTIAFALTVWAPSARYIGPALLALVVCAIPARAARSMAYHRLPQYDALARGSLEVRRRMPAARAIRVGFELPPSTDPLFIYQSLGGRVAADAPFDATIAPDGSVRFAPVVPDRAAAMP